MLKGSFSTSLRVVILQFVGVSIHLLYLKVAKISFFFLLGISFAVFRT